MTRTRFKAVWFQIFQELSHPDITSLHGLDFFSLMNEKQKNNSQTTQKRKKHQSIKRLGGSQFSAHFWPFLRLAETYPPPHEDYNSENYFQAASKMNILTRINLTSSLNIAQFTSYRKKCPVAVTESHTVKTVNNFPAY